jgi:PAS domain-containing protein
MANLNIDQDFQVVLSGRDALEILQHMPNGIAYCKMVYRDGVACGWIYLWTNSAFQTQTGFAPVAGKFSSELIPDIRESDAQLIETYGRVAAGGAPETFETFVERLQQWFQVQVYSPKPEHFVAIFDVITERKQAEITERERSKHDLQDSLHLLARTEMIAQVGHWSYEVADQSREWSDELWNIFGRKPHSVELTYDIITSWIREDFRAFHHEKLRQMCALKPGETVHDLVYCLVRPNGEERWAEVFLETERLSKNSFLLSFYRSSCW